MMTRYFIFILPWTDILLLLGLQLVEACLPRLILFMGEKTQTWELLERRGSFSHGEEVESLILLDSFLHSLKITITDKELVIFR